MTKQEELDAAWAAYKEAETSVWAAYTEAEAPVWAAYGKIRISALAAYIEAVAKIEEKYKDDH